MNHCVSCGYCCTLYCVSFNKKEITSGYKTPIELTEIIDSNTSCMKGTKQTENRRCTSLIGELGKEVGCSIYGNRPSPCREFAMSGENDEVNERCESIRKQFGLKRIT